MEDSEKGCWFQNISKFFHQRKIRLNTLEMIWNCLCIHYFYYLQLCFSLLFPLATRLPASFWPRKWRVDFSSSQVKLDPNPLLLSVKYWQWTSGLKAHNPLKKIKFILKEGFHKNSFLLTRKLVPRRKMEESAKGW